MSIRKLAGYSIAAIAGAVMLATSAAPASAFTLAGPPLQPVASAQIDKVWWDRWGRWHPNYYYRPYYHPYYHRYYRPYYHPYYHRYYRPYYHRY
jgi:hypothetical protein